MNMRKESTFCIKSSIGTRIDIKLLGQCLASFLMKNTLQATPSLLIHDPNLLLTVMTVYSTLAIVLKLLDKYSIYWHKTHKKFIIHCIIKCIVSQVVDVFISLDMQMEFIQYSRGQHLSQIQKLPSKLTCFCNLN